MGYNEKLSDKIREALSGHTKVEEKYMFGGVCYMLNGKMYIGVVEDEMMCRIGPDVYDEAIEKAGCHEMVFTGKPMKRYVYVSEEGYKNKKQFDNWIGLCVAFNKYSKAAKKKEEEIRRGLSDHLASQYTPKVIIHLILANIW